MAKRPPGTPGTKTITFEAALPHAGSVFTLNADGEARLTIIISATAARPLAEAMAAQVLNDTTFAVSLTYPEAAPTS